MARCENVIGTSKGTIMCRRTANHKGPCENLELGVQWGIVSAEQREIDRRALRERLAAAALTGLLARPGHAIPYNVETEAVRVADATLAELEKGEVGNG